MNLAKKLKSAREKSGYTQSEVAEKLNITRQSVSRWENGWAYPDVESLVMLSDLYAVSTDELLREGVSKKNINEETDVVIKTQLEQLIIVGVAMLSCVIPVVGLLVNMGVILFCCFNKIKLKSICWFVIISCIIINIANAYVVLSVELFDFGKGSIEKIAKGL